MGVPLGAAGLSSYALIRRAGDDQTVNLSAGDHLEFNNFDGVGISVSSGGAQDQVSGLIELESAGTWLLLCWVDAIFSGAGGVLSLRWRNNTAAANIGFDAQLNPLTSALNSFRVPSAIALGTFATPVQVEVRILSSSLLTQISESDTSGMRALALKLAA